MTTTENAPAAGPAPVHGGTGFVELLYEGRLRMSVAIGSWVRWSLLSLVGLGSALALYHTDVYRDWPVWLLVLLGVPGLLWTYLEHVTTHYKITTRRVEFERGIFGRELDSLELWRVLDLRYKQSLLDRMTGNAKITLMSMDQTHPQLVLHGLPEPRAIFERLRDAIQDNRRTNRPMEFTEGGSDLFGDTELNQRS